MFKLFFSQNTWLPTPQSVVSPQNPSPDHPGLGPGPPPGSCGPIHMDSNLHIPCPLVPTCPSRTLALQGLPPAVSSFPEQSRQGESWSPELSGASPAGGRPGPDQGGRWLLTGPSVLLFTRLVAEFFTPILLLILVDVSGTLLGRSCLPSIVQMCKPRPKGQVPSQFVGGGWWAGGT